MALRQRVLRYWIYFRRGHSTYLAFLLSFANFVVIQYRLLIEYVPAMKVLFSSLLAFAVTFFLVYVPLAIVIGWLDFKRFSVPVETSITASVSPWHRDLMKALVLIAEGRSKEAVEILRRWIEV